MKKLITIVALTLTVVASPAFAQYNPGPTTGSASNQSEHTLGFYGSRSGRIAGQRSGMRVFNMVPQAPSAINSSDSAATGGGSAGYNQDVITDE